MITDHQKQLLRQLPAIHELLQHPTVLELDGVKSLDQETMTLLCQESVQAVRESIIKNDVTDAEMMLQTIFSHLNNRLNALLHSPLKPLINGTGVVLHTNLGRAKLSQKAQKALSEVATYYSSLEYDIKEGKRGSRHDIVEDLICHLTGAEAALVCNNNAAAVFLVLKELANDREVIVSRGELVEIGGSFRVFEIMRESGALLNEVGTTNKTHLYDYERALNDNTGLIMKVHTSNFVIKGFTAAVAGHELVEMAHKHGVPVFEDLGSGVLCDLKRYGIGDEPTVQEVIQEGVDLVSFSGDKLLGGPQAGIIAGKANLINRLKKNQLMRSLRVDKFTLAALHETLKAYLNPEKALQEIPTLQMITESKTSIKDRALTFMSKMNDSGFDCELIEVDSEVGGGTMPDVYLPSYGVHIKHENMTSAQISQQLRLSQFPIVGRINDERFILDFRTIDDHEIDTIVHSISGLKYS